MEYPGSHLSKPWRRIILIICFVAFFIISTIVILIAAGYRYDWTNGLLRETGSISIDIKPANAIIYLNDVEIKDKIPIRLNNITPRKYLLKITAPGYYDWQKEVEVKNKQTVYIKEISLLKKNEPQKIINRAGNNLTLSYDGRYLAYYADNGIWIYDRNTQIEKKIIKWNEQDIPEIKWSLKKYYLAVGDKNDSSIIIIIDVEKQSIWNISNSQNLMINKFQWQETAETELIFSTDKKILVARPNTKKIIEVSDNKYQDWFSDNGSIWTLQTNSSTAQIRIVKDTLGFATDWALINLTGNDNNINQWQINHAKGDIILLQKKNTREMLIVENNKYFNVNGDKSLISPYNNWWLIWTPWELNSYSIGSEPELLNRSSEQLQQVLPLDEYNTLLLIWDDKSTVLFPYYNVGHILIDKKINSSAVDSKNKILYYSIDIKNKNGIWQLKY